MNEITTRRNYRGSTRSSINFRHIGGLSPLAVTCSLILHLSFFLTIRYFPSIFPNKPLLDDEIITVDLVSPLPDVQAPTPPAAPRPVKAPKPQAPEPPKPVVASTAEMEPTVTPAPVDAKPISLKPLKRKIRKAEDTRLEEEKVDTEKEAARLRELQRQQELAQQRAREQQQALA
ncbi:MAG: hypothetical protein OEV64_14985, partial [Desulfobulbaceae bacterium]|nr:hypothetical protein [Desulfobulbaceae bacterium]